LTWTEGGGPTFSALLRAWHAVVTLDALLRGCDAPTYPEFTEALGQGDQATARNAARGLNEVDPHLLVAASLAAAPPPAASPEQGAVLRQRHALVAWAEELNAELRSRYPRPHARRGPIIACAIAATLMAALWLARRPPVWRVEYFRTRSLEDPIASDLTAALGGDWGNGSPHAGVPDDEFSSRWETCLLLHRETQVTFLLGSDDGSRLIVDNQTLIAQWREQEYAEQTASVRLAAGEHYLLVEHFEASGDAALLLRARLDGKGTFAALPRKLLHAPRSGPAPCGP
jgi:hypothetical protein